MGLWDSIKRVGLGVSTGGLSEVARYGMDHVSKGGIGDTLFGGTRTATPGDRDLYDWGGRPEAAQEMRDYFRSRAEAAGGRGAYQLNRQPATDAMVGFGGAMGNDRFDRAEQAKALEMARAAAEGKAPSAAEAQMRAGLEESSRLGQNLAAGAAGANPLLAATNAAASSADAARRSTTAAAAMRADEMARARADYAGIAGGMRSADQAAGQSWLSAGQFGMGVEGQQANLEMQQRGLNSQDEQAYMQHLLQMERDALAGRMGYGGAQLGASQTNAQTSVQRRGQNQQLGTDIAKGVYGAFMGGGFGG